MFKPLGGNQLLDIGLVLEKAQIGDKMTVADLGCGGSGFFVFPIAKTVGKNGKVYAIDILKMALENIKKRARQENLSNIKAVWSDLEIFGATKIEPASVDVVMLVNTLYQSSKRAAILREAVRILKRKGRMVIVEWKNTSLPFGPPIDNRVKKDLLIMALKKLGLKINEEFEAGQYHYGIVCVKV